MDATAFSFSSSSSSSASSSPGSPASLVSGCSVTSSAPERHAFLYFVDDDLMEAIFEDEISRTEISSKRKLKMKEITATYLILLLSFGFGFYNLPFLHWAISRS